MINEELISAYLDGELTAPEQAQVEQALAADARLRQMHDDLRALRGSLQSLPQHKLDAHFAERVLLAAKRAQESQQAHPAVPASTSKPHEPEVILTSHHGKATSVELAQHEPMAWRVVVWSIASLAAVVMVMLFLPKSTEIAERPRTKQVAQRDREERTKDAQQVAGKQAASDGHRATRSEEMQASPPTDFKAAEVAEKQLKSIERNNVAPASPLAKGQAEENVQENRATVDIPAPAKKFDAAVPKPATMRRGAPEADADAASVAGGAGKPQEQNAASATGVLRHLDRKSRLKELSQLQIAAADEVIVVRLKTSRKNVNDQTIDKVLGRNAIAMRETVDAAAEKTTRTADSITDSVASERLAGNKDAALRPQLDQLALASTDADVVYVEASLEQFEAAIDELKSQPGNELEFTSLNDELADRSEAAKRSLAAGGAPPGPSAANQSASDPPGGKARGFSAGSAAKMAVEAGAKPTLHAQRDQRSDDNLVGEPPARKQNAGYAERLAINRDPAARGAALPATPGAPPPAAKAEVPGFAAQARSAVVADEAAKEAENMKASDKSKEARPAQRVRVVFVIEATDE